MVLDDITFRECVKQAPAVTIPARQTPVASEKKPAEVKKPVKKQAGVTTPPVKNREKTVALTETKKEATTVQVKQPSTEVPVPLILRTRENTLAKQIETTAGEIRVDLYDNGEIDGDTVSIYHNNTMVVSEARLSQKPVTVRFTVDEAHPHHELVMVAENLGSIPPNTSLMIVTAKDKRYQVFITSSEQKNAKVNIDLKNQ